MKNIIYSISFIFSIIWSDIVFSAEEKNDLNNLKETDRPLKTISSTAIPNKEPNNTRNEEKKEFGQQLRRLPKINLFIKHIENITVPEELEYIQRCFKELSETEQYQYDLWINAYERIKGSPSKNPAAIALLSQTDGYVQASVVQREDEGPLYHTEQTLIRSFLLHLNPHKLYPKEINNMRIGLYTQNSPCLLDVSRFYKGEKHNPCIHQIMKLFNIKNVSNENIIGKIMVIYDFFYDDPRIDDQSYPNYKALIALHSKALEKVKEELIKKIGKNLTLCESYGQKLLKDSSEMTGKNKKQSSVIINLLLLTLKNLLQDNIKKCTTSKKFQDLPRSFFGTGSSFNSTYHNPNLSLIFMQDIIRIEKPKPISRSIIQFFDGKTNLDDVKIFLLNLLQYLD